MRQLDIDEIPRSVKALPMLARHIWLRVYNRSIKVNKPNKSVENAWNVVKVLYKKTPKGKWMKRP